MPTITRRGFLGIGAAGLATLWLPRRPRAAPAAATARRLLLLHAGGGMRSTALFNADVAPQWNPFGKVATTDVDTTGAPLLAAGAAWGVGKVLVGDARPIPLAQWDGATLPLVSQIADRISVLGAVDHDPTAAAGDDNHYSATIRMCTGQENGVNGILTILSKELDGAPLAPTIVGGAGPIGASVYGAGAGDLARYRPIYLNGPTDFRFPRAAGGATDPGYAAMAEATLDGDVASARAQAMGGRAASFIVTKQLGLEYGAVLATDALRLAYVPTPALGTTTGGAPLTNAMLGEPFGVAAGTPPPPGFDADGFWGGPTALAVRLLQLGAPAVAVGVGGWDFHSDEDRGLPPLAASLGRALSALHFVLSRLVDPDVPGKTYFDTTLIAVTSEFGRDNTSDADGDGLAVGFNRGNGSDHHGTNACRYQALPIMGGGVPGGRLIVPTDDKVSPMGDPIASPSLLATFLAALGVDPQPYVAAPPLPEIYG